jgi:N-methylhydantoinase A
VVAQPLMRIGVDVGGTFTDVVTLDADGQVAVGKAPSVKGGVSDDVWDIVERLIRHAPDGAVQALVHGTTVATNALLERTGGRVVLITTAGFEDLLWLRRQDRAALYDLSADHPPPLVARGDVVGVDERIGPTDVIRSLTDDEVRRVVAAARERAPGSVAVCLLFSFRDPTHERRLGSALREALPDVPVAVSHEVLPVFREFERLGTTAAEAYLRPRVERYLQRMGTVVEARGIRAFRVMASNGGTLRVQQACERAAALALSGPAGGVEGARLIGEALGIADLLTLDMGGTSADASIVLGGRPLTQAAGTIGGVPVAVPHVLIETVGAGGGSLAWVDAGGALRVGPRSAGADPGPACYGKGGEEPTVTDAALVLGWLDAEQPLASTIALDCRAAERALGRIARRVGLGVERVAEGVVEIATATMVRALRRVSVERGVDPRGTALLAFGGAGPLFAGRMAEALGMRRAVIPPHAGVLSALGLAAAPEKLEFVASVHRTTRELSAQDMQRAFHDLEAEAERELEGAILTRLADCRYPGQGYEVTVPAGEDGAGVAAAFHAAHEDRFGHADPGRSVEIVNIRLIATGRGTAVRLKAAAGGRRRPRAAGTAGRIRFADLAPGTEIDGPVVLDAPDFTGRIEAGWRGTMHASGAVVLERT